MVGRKNGESGPRARTTASLDYEDPAAGALSSRRRHARALSAGRSDFRSPFQVVIGRTGVAAHPLRHGAVRIGVCVGGPELNRGGKVLNRELALARSQVHVTSGVIGHGGVGLDLERLVESLDGIRKLIRLCIFLSLRSQIHHLTNLRRRGGF